MKRSPLVDRYIDLLKDENERINLFSKSAYDKLHFHIEDSITLATLIHQKGQHIIDMGSGSGLPSVILAIQNPDMTITAVESKTKKCRFLEKVKDTLSLENYFVINDDINAYIRRDKPHADIITAKAFAPYDKAIQVASKFAQKGTTLWIPISNAQFTILDKLNLKGVTLYQHPDTEFYYLKKLF